ncbi:MAG: HTTM domain-containing protein [Bdellovibrionaceae bacterium]|nr:HTTM domain-containing protein [Pseudobdellovibrionaceae bacterium]
MRVAFGLLLLFNWLTTFPYRAVFYGENAVITFKTAALVSNYARLDLFGILPQTDTGVYILCMLNLAAALGVLFGLFTRTSLALGFLTVMTFHNRNVFILNSADTLFQNILFLLIFSGAGKMFSLDKVFFGKNQEQEELHAPWALRLIQMQFCMVYISTILFKFKGEAWMDGSAIYIATRLDDLVRLPMPWLLDSMLMIKLMTWGTLVVELSLGTLVWIRELRYWVLAAGVALHLGIEMLMNIPMFEYIMIFTMLSMIDPDDMKKAIQWMKSKTPKSAETASSEALSYETI